MYARACQILPNRLVQSLTGLYFRARKLQTIGFSGQHSVPICYEMSTFSVAIIPALQDNYMYLIVDEATKEAAIVDPVNPEAVFETVRSHKVNLTKVLTTHHHWDHAGGNGELIAKSPDKLKIYGGDDRIEGLTNAVKQDDTFNIGNLVVKCLSTPCHTTGHICYYIECGDERAVFTGDTLFMAGCGRFFEGTAEQMHDALINKLGKLPNDTKVFCGHEYSIQNLMFAKLVEPVNETVLSKIEWATEQRMNKVPTIPTTIGLEKEINPFMRVNELSVRKFAGSNDPVEVMAFIRKEKDTFKV